MIRTSTQASLLGSQIFSRPDPIERSFLLPVRISKAMLLEIFAFKSLNFVKVFLDGVRSILCKSQKFFDGGRVQVEKPAKTNIESHPVKVAGQFGQGESWVYKANFVSGQPVICFSSMMSEFGSLVIPVDMVVTGQDPDTGFSSSTCRAEENMRNTPLN